LNWTSPLLTPIVFNERSSPSPGISDANEKGEKGRDELENSIADFTWLSLLYALGNQPPKKLFHQHKKLSN
jgi:hypothetical protein